MTSSTPFPIGPISSIRGTTVVVRGDDIDTDRIIPARFLKCVTFDALGPAAFADDRAELTASPAGPHPFDRLEHHGAAILLVNRNFGCGSSREHAPQALMRWGIRAVVGESFAEIFYGNCLALGIPCLAAGHDTMLAIQAAAQADPAAVFEVDVANACLSLGEQSWALDLAAGPRQMLSTGQWDATGQLLANGKALEAAAARLPYLSGFVAATR
ncbi:3-isopropylmalate dehydratase small subunit [Vulcanococcus sp.]|uniref:3-isopropylmalate dehydratase small subunit n=1 Tax=Vulcanococcus sp. TaxID=2856995 RepID=UPI003F6999CF